MPDMLCAWHFFSLLLPLLDIIIVCICIAMRCCFRSSFYRQRAANGRWIGNVCSNVACRLAFVWNFLRRRRSAKNGFRSVPFATKTFGEANPMAFKTFGSFHTSTDRMWMHRIACLGHRIPRRNRKEICVPAQFDLLASLLSRERAHPSDGAANGVAASPFLCYAKSRNRERKTTSPSGRAALSLRFRFPFG